MRANLTAAALLAGLLAPASAYADAAGTQQASGSNPFMFLALVVISMLLGHAIYVMHRRRQDRTRASSRATASKTARPQRKKRPHKKR
ncbi:hypothetical protein H6A21_08175 [Collinsella tanakaei]|nr:hypothetical protein [Collinsella tanakaei]